MERYLAFLRGINVSGQKLIKMVDLKNHLEDMGLKKVQTYIQSGNVCFEYKDQHTDELSERIEQGLQERLGYHVPVIVRTWAEINDLIARDPFQSIEKTGDLKLYVCFPDQPSENIPVLPVVSEKEGLEIIGIDDRFAFVVSKPVGKGRYGFPNNFIEKELKITATSRYWKTLLKMVEKFG